MWYQVMKGPPVLRVSLAFVLSAPVCSPMFAQTSWKAEHCHILETASEPSGPKVVIDDLVLDGNTDVSETVWNAVVSGTKAKIFSGDSWVDELKEVDLRGGLRNRGYFKAEVSAEARVISSSPVLEHVVVRAHVRGGPQYTLSGVRFRNMDSEEKHLVFSAEELRVLIPLHDGDVFSAEKVRNGLDALRRYYSSRGYIDFVAGVETQIDDTQQRIAVLLLLDEGVQFRLGQIETVGLDARLENQLRLTVRSGDVVNLQVIADFYQNHKSELPEDVLPEDTQFRRNFKEKTVDAILDFRSCSQLLQN
jgi:outer membrane protein assembly factor BamA